MPAMTLARSGKRYSHEEWIAMSSDEQSQILSKDGPAYTDEAWQKHHGSNNKRKR